MTITNNSLKKLSGLLAKIKVNLKDFDNFLARSPHIYRSIRGHAFEIWFDRQITKRGFTVIAVGGDDVVDRVINGRTLQLKTPYLKGTIKDKMVSYKMHKTHGAERKPLCFYTKREFADFFIGLHPELGVIICPKNKLKTRGEISKRLDYPNYISDPLPFAWDTEWLNRYDLIGLSIKDYPTIVKHSKEEIRLFPRLIGKIGFTDYDILHAILDEKNFRIWFQLIVGSIREFHFAKFAKIHDIKLKPPQGLGGRGNQKVDYVLNNGKRIQVKGLTKGMCDEVYLGCETQCSHGRVPTRLYRRNDFDNIVIVIDPGFIPENVAKQKGISSADYNFVILPISKLPRHERSKEWGREYIKSSFRFKPEEVKYNQFQLLLSK